MRFECIDYVVKGFTTYHIYDELGNVVGLDLEELKQLHTAISHELGCRGYEEQEEEELG